MGKNDKVRDNKKTLWALVIILLVSGVAILSISVVIISSDHKESEKKYISPDELSQQIDKQHEMAMEEERKSMNDLADAVIKTILAYREANGVYPKTLDEANANPNNMDIKYNYNGVNKPTITYKIDGNEITKTVE